MDYSKYPNNRKEAKLTKAKYYFTGNPCKHGHIALRKTKGNCVDCMKIEWSNPSEARKEYFTNYNKSEAGQAAKRRYYEANKEDVIARATARPDADKHRYRMNYKKNDPDKYRELVGLRQRRRKQATPKWLTATHKMEIRLKYRLARELSRITGIKYVVDHIIPMFGKTVCGLHVPWNLDVITHSENSKKSNKLLDIPHQNVI